VTFASERLNFFPLNSLPLEFERKKCVRKVTPLEKIESDFECVFTQFEFTRSEFMRSEFTQSEFKLEERAVRLEYEFTTD